MTLPAKQLQNYYSRLLSELEASQEDEELSADGAFARLLSKYLGLDDSLGESSDGAYDCGVDYWELFDDSANVYQLKRLDQPPSKVSEVAKASATQLSDIRRVVELFENLEGGPKKANRSVTKFLANLRARIERGDADPDAEPFRVRVYLCSMSRGFTEQAQGEVDKLSQSREIEYRERKIELDFVPVMLEDLLLKRWHSHNSEWRDRTNKKRDSIKLRVGENAWIRSAKSAVFFTKAIDLVRAFEDFGYQLFEPNVRCELTKSKVNQAIGNSVKSARGRREFKHLNNGITLICAAYRRHGGNPPESLSVTQPGIINGLQTVKAIHDAYHELDDRQRSEFETNCEVLVRLHGRNAVADYRDLVKSTNNQNPMKLRNLRSNNAEQVAFERLFADLGWFYERKEGAWNAYKSDSKLWGSLSGYRVANFKYGKGAKQVRVIDNGDLAQTWLSFLGFSSEAIHKKRSLFDDDPTYELIFNARPEKVGAEYGYLLRPRTVLDESEKSSPDPSTMLVSYLAREAARHLVPSNKRNRDSAVERLALSGTSREEQDGELAKDDVYVTNKILRAMSLMFPELVGYVLYRSLGSDYQLVGSRVLRNHSFAKLASERDFAGVVESTQTRSFAEDDFLLTLWELFRLRVTEMVNTPSWQQQWKTAAVRSRFNHSPKTRKLLFEGVDHFDAYLGKSQVFKDWADGLNRARGVYSYTRELFGGGDES